MPSKKGESDPAPVESTEPEAQQQEEETQSQPNTLERVAEGVNKRCGAGAMTLATEQEKIPRLPTGIYRLTYMSGGGYPALRKSGGLSSSRN